MLFKTASFDPPAHHSVWPLALDTSEAENAISFKQRKTNYWRVVRRGSILAAERLLEAITSSVCGSLVMIIIDASIYWSLVQDSWATEEHHSAVSVAHIVGAAACVLHLLDILLSVIAILSARPEYSSTHWQSSEQSAFFRRAYRQEAVNMQRRDASNSTEDQHSVVEPITSTHTGIAPVAFAIGSVLTLLHLLLYSWVQHSPLRWLMTVTVAIAIATFAFPVWLITVGARGQRGGDEHNVKTSAGLEI